MQIAAPLVMIVSAFGMVGCQSMPTDHDRPARIINPDTASRTALQSTVDSALGVHVTLSDAALTDSSLLTIENRPRPTIENPVPQGRDMQMPIQFRLVKNGDDCVLIRQQDRSRHILTNTACAPE